MFQYYFFPLYFGFQFTAITILLLFTNYLVHVYYTFLFGRLFGLVVFVLFFVVRKHVLIKAEKKSRKRSIEQGNHIVLYIIVKCMHAISYYMAI